MVEDREEAENEETKIHLSQLTFINNFKEGKRSRK
jgi:hypothetical protein